jgi:hypothetical protein
MFYPYDNVYGKHCRLVKTLSHEHRWSLQVKAVVSDASWIPAVCEAHNVVDGWHIQSKTVVCQRGVKALNAVEAVQNLLREFQRPYCMGYLLRRNNLAS